MLQPPGEFHLIALAVIVFGIILIAFLQGRGYYYRRDLGFVRSERSIEKHSWDDSRFKAILQEM